MADDRKLLAEWFWTDRWMGSSAFLLPIAPRGLYREMLTQAWRRGARLPNDFEAIRRAVGCTQQEWNRYWPRVQGYWRVDGDSLVNDTQVEVYAEMMAGLHRASERAARGAAARWHKDGPSNAQASAQAHAQVVLEQCTPKPTPKPDLPERAPGDLSVTRARGTGAGVMAGSLPRDHVRHAFCGRKCVPDFLHGEFRQSIGGPDPEASVRQFYVDVLAGIPDDQPIGDEPLKFWRAQFAARFGTTTPTGKTAGNLAAAAAFVARGKA